MKKKSEETPLKWYKEEKGCSCLYSSLVGEQHLLSLLYLSPMLDKEPMVLPSALWMKEVFIQTLLQSKFRGGNLS